MTNYTYKQILTKAKTCKTNVKKEYKLGITSRWSYYFAKAILTPNKNIKKLSLADAPNPNGSYISNQIKKNDYLKIAKEYCAFCEKHKRFPNYASYGKYKLRPRLLTIFFANILVYREKNKKLPDKANINSKWFTRPVEYKNVVYKYFVEKTGKRFTTIDDLLSWMSGRGYGKYSDDIYSNKTCIDRMISKKGINCTDSLQFLINMAEEMGYDWKCIHVRCRTSGIGHVFGKFRHKKHTGNEWITRDPASVLDGNGVRSVWCENGYLLATNPSWFMENLNR